MPEPDTAATVEQYRCPARLAVEDGYTVRCIFSPHGRELQHMVRRSGTGQIVRWADDDA